MDAFWGPGFDAPFETTSPEAATIHCESAPVGVDWDQCVRVRSWGAFHSFAHRPHLQAVWAVPRGGSFYRFRTSFAALGAVEAFALHCGFRASLLSGFENVLRHRNLTLQAAARRISPPARSSPLAGHRPRHLPARPVSSSSLACP